jgi:hypothetical protein
MSKEVEGIMKGLEITGESPLDTVFSHKDIGMVNISRMEASIAAQDPIWYPMLCEWDPENLVAMLAERDIDRARIAALTADPVRCYTRRVWKSSDWRVPRGSLFLNASTKHNHLRTC